MHVQLAQDVAAQDNSLRWPCTTACITIASVRIRLIELANIPVLCIYLDQCHEVHKQIEIIIKPYIKPVLAMDGASNLND